MQKTQPDKMQLSEICKLQLVFQKTGFSQVLTTTSDIAFGFILLYLMYFHKESFPRTILSYILWTSFYRYMFWLSLSKLQKEPLLVF